ncbi:hypothetical protein SBA6_40042 [Candidatus Sulfopaludibacter sp. SbA6]|nr:hypothetical protein SBA6_40042 [Candidatus Sulfopaludibacter sp. SbA6]
MSPVPTLSRYAVCSSTAWTSRKSRSSAPGTLEAAQVAPPLVVLSQVPPVPLAQAMSAFTALTPRRDAVVVLFCATQDWARAKLAQKNAIAGLMWLLMTECLQWVD